MRNLIAVTFLLSAAVLICRSQPQGGQRGVTFQDTQEIYSIECGNGNEQCRFNPGNGKLYLDAAVVESTSRIPFHRIECDPGLSCNIEGDKLVITSGGGK